MKEKNQLQIGDTVLWRGDPPRAPRQTALVTGIDCDVAADFNHTGVAVDKLKWKHVKQAIVTFDSDSWAYGSNIRRLKKPKAWRSDGYTRPEPVREPESAPSLVLEAERQPEKPRSEVPEATPRPVEQAENPSVADDQQHIDFMPGLLQYEWETTPDDSEDRKTFRQGIAQAQAWLHGMERAHGREPAGVSEEGTPHSPA